MVKNIRNFVNQIKTQNTYIITRMSEENTITCTFFYTKATESKSKDISQNPPSSTAPQHAKSLVTTETNQTQLHKTQNCATKHQQL